MLTTFQSWSIATRRVAWHRASGLAVFALVPMFAAGSALALQGLMALHVAAATPFHAAYGARLTATDVIAAPVFVMLVALSLHWRRNVRAHAAAMLATALLVLPPVLGRLLPILPGFPADGALGLRPFELSFHIAEGISAVVSLILARDRAGRGPFLIVAGAGIAQMIAFETVARTAWWDQTARLLLPVPPLALATVVAGAAGAALWLGWRRHRPAATIGPAAAPVPAPV